MLGSRLKTKQTGPSGLKVSHVLLAPAADIDGSCIYVAAWSNSTRRAALSGHLVAGGGMDIEEVAATTPEKILTAAVHPRQACRPTRSGRWATPSA